MFLLCAFFMYILSYFHTYPCISRDLPGLLKCRQSIFKINPNFLFLLVKNYPFNRHGTIHGLGPPPGRLAPRPPGGRSSTAAPSCPPTAFILQPLCTGSSRRPCTLASLSLLASTGKAPPTGGPMKQRRRPSRGTPGSTSSL